MPPRYDVIIVGAGAAGLSAALFCARRGLSTLVLSQDIGGQAATTGGVENYPGIDHADGFELMMTFKTQAEKYGAKIILEEVAAVKKADDGFSVSTAHQSYDSTALLLANGLMHRHLNIPGEDKFIGRGVSYCATCDAPLFKGRQVMVIGGGNSAMDAALLLSKFCPHVTIATVNPEFRGEQVLIERMNETPTITQLTKTITKEITGAESLTGVRVETQGQSQTILAAGVFVEIGYTVNPKLVQGLTPLDQRNQIIVDPATNGTDLPGLFAAGDVTNILHKQIVISAGEGAKAALGVDGYLQALGHKPTVGNIDWGRSIPRHHENPPSASSFISPTSGVKA